MVTPIGAVVTAKTGVKKVKGIGQVVKGTFVSHLRPEDRPTFAELASQMKDIAAYMQQHPPTLQPSAQVPLRPPRPSPAPRPEKRTRT